MKKPIVIYHKSCADGIAAAWCFWKQFGDSMEYIPGVYNERPPDIFGREVYFVDFSYPYDTVKDMLKFADNIVMLDHHASAIDDLWDLYKEPNFNMDWCTTEKSGARIAWDYVKATTKHNRKIPQFLLHVEDYDLYKLQLPGSKAIAKANYSGELSLERCDRLMGMSKSGLKGFQKKGEILLEALENDIKRIADSCSRLLDIGGFRVPAANANAIFSTELGNYLSKGQPFAATYYDIKKYRIYSLRSQPDGMDVSKIAKMYDGGGHPRAAGFRVARSHPLARV